MSEDENRAVRVSERLRCCFCGQGTSDAEDYVFMELTSEKSVARQWFGAHAACLNQHLHEGFTVEVHLA